MEYVNLIFFQFFPISNFQAEKDFRSKQLIREAIMENDFLKNLPSGQVREIVDYMEKKKVVAGAYVIKEGDQGKLLRQ